ncbi:MAG: hypothetical protein M3M85_03660 [bacterium]|nr:hypothetical protein [bacterium]
MEENPILSKWHKGKETADTKIGDGFVSAHTGRKIGLRRKNLDTPEGEKFYVYKEIGNMKEAKDSMEIYQKMKMLNLPVVEFAKIIKKRSADEKDEFLFAMEDLTRNGEYEVIEVVLSSLIREIPTDITEGMVKALATVHNHGMYDYHPNISFALRTKNDQVVDFKIIDYANFTTKERERSWASYREGDFENECEKDLFTLLDLLGLGKQDQENLASLYRKERSLSINTSV